MTSFKDLLNRTTSRKPIGSVPLIIREPDRSQFDLIPGEFVVVGLDKWNFLRVDGDGYLLFDCPIYSLSSAQKKEWDTASQKISAIVMGAADDEAVSIMLSGGGEGELSTRSQMTLFSIGAENAILIRSYEEVMVAAALGLQSDQLALITSVRGYGDRDDDFFSIILEQLRSAFKPLEAITSPSDSGKGKKSNP